MELFKKLGAVAVALVMAAATILPMASVDVSADTATTPTAIEDVDFNYAYDVQRWPAYPASGQDVEMWTLENPIKGPTAGDSYTSSAGEWSLKAAGKYSEVSDPSITLQSIASSMKSAYNVESADDFIIHKLLNGVDVVAHGMVVAYDPEKGMAIFLGDSLPGSAGYLLTTTAQTDEYTRANPLTMKATQIATDIADITPVNPPSVDEDKTDDSTTQPTTPAEKPAEPAKDKTPSTGDDSNAVAWMAILMLSGAALAGFGVNRKFNAN